MAQKYLCFLSSLGERGEKGEKVMERESKIVYLPKIAVRRRNK